MPAPKSHLNEKAKEARNAGLEHTTPRGFKCQARTMKPLCKLSCNRCHKRRLLEDERQQIFDSFWKLENINRKRDFLSRCIRCSTPKTCNTLTERARKTSRTYFFVIENEEIRVCKTAFLNTLGVCDQWVETTLKKIGEGNVLAPDLRGRHKNRPQRWARAIIDGIKTHIESFPRVHSHYTRARSKREYLETGLSIQRMYRFYKQRAAELAQRVGSFRLYRRIFNQNYNLGFFLPKKDQCEVCNRWKTAKDRRERLAMLQEYNIHLRQRKAIKTLKKNDKDSAGSKKCVACFDLQKVLICPRSDTSVLFYRNKLSIFNLTIFELAPKIGHAFVWNETEAKKGSNEIGTCLFNFKKKK